MSEQTAKTMDTEVDFKDMIGKIQGEMLGVIGDLIVTETWLQEGWTGTLEEITPVVPVLERTVTATREAADKVLKLTHNCNLR